MSQGIGLVSTFLDAPLLLVDLVFVPIGEMVYMGNSLTKYSSHIRRNLKKLFKNLILSDR